MPHLATTYAAVNSLITLGGHRSFSSVNRWSVYNTLNSPLFCEVHYYAFYKQFDANTFTYSKAKIYSFLLRMKDASGGFRYDIVLRA